MRVLIVEDEAELAALTAQGLSAAGFACDVAATLEDAGLFLDGGTYDAVVLDLQLPDGDGLALLQRLRGRGSSVPVLLLTARDGIGDRVRGLDSGADDYMLKPFALEELAARLRALLRRPGAVLGLHLELGNLTLDTVARQVMVDDVRVALSRREIDVLEPLLRRAGKVVPKSALEDSVYALGEEVSSNAVEAQVSRLRRRLAQAGAEVRVHTLRGIGYMLTAAEGETIP
ncbi:MAG: transcriptional regulator [Rhodospirillaceae bacterium BRH_c57]|nr:MAG: transcriptional regulator [Rhodospirillaceae bacterium BRH_c57]